MAEGDEHLSRDDRRRRTEVAILAAARRRFAERGFERTTIRGIAAAAGVDPALVMQHFGSKDALFAAAARWSTDHDELLDTPREDLARAALAHVLDAFEDAERHDAAVAVLRSALTHQGARAVLRDAVMGPAQEAVAATIGGEDAALRAAVLNACTLGLAISRYMVGVPALVEADRDALERVVTPALRAVVDVRD